MKKTLLAGILAFVMILASFAVAIPAMAEDGEIIFTVTTDKDTYYYGDVMTITAKYTYADGSVGDLDELCDGMLYHVSFPDPIHGDADYDVNFVGATATVKIPLEYPSLEVGRQELWSETLNFGDSDVEDAYEPVVFNYAGAPEGTVIINETPDLTEGEDIVIDAGNAEKVVFSGSAFEGMYNVWLEGNMDTLRNSFTLKMGNITIKLDPTAFQKLLWSSVAEVYPVTFQAREVTLEHMTEAQKKVLDGKTIRGAVNIDVWVAFREWNYFEGFGDGKVTVTVPVAGTPDGTKVGYVAEDGTVTAMNTAIVNGTLTFETNHFSVYVALPEAELNALTGGSNPPAGGNNPPAGGGSGSDIVSPETGDSSLVVLCLMVVISAAGIVLCRKAQRASR